MNAIKETTEDLLFRTDLKAWAKLKSAQHVRDIKYYISQGICKETAIEMVLENSCIGAGYKAQIRYEISSGDVK